MDSIRGLGNPGSSHTDEGPKLDSVWGDAATEVPLPAKVKGVNTGALGDSSRLGSGVGEDPADLWSLRKYVALLDRHRPFERYGESIRGNGIEQYAASSKDEGISRAGVLVSDPHRCFCGDTK